jgi:HSP20 family protein
MATATKETKPKESQGTELQNQSRAAGGAPVPQRREGPFAGGWEPVRRLRDEFDRMFDQFFHGWPAHWTGEGMGHEWYWGMDVQEDDNAVSVRAEAPGFEPDEFDIQVRGDRMTVRAAHKMEAGDQARGYREWGRQEFFRSIALPAEIDADKVTANYRNGVLTVTLPKAEGSKPRRITVQG